MRNIRNYEGKSLTMTPPQILVKRDGLKKKAESPSAIRHKAHLPTMEVANGLIHPNTRPHLQF